MKIDIHAHILSERMMERMQAVSSELAPRIVERYDGWAVLQIGDFRYQPYPIGGWDLERRLRDMDSTGVDMQALSVVPFCFLYHVDAALGREFARIQNEEIAALARERPDRFVGLATLTMQEPKTAAGQLREAIEDMGLRGAAIGTNVAERNLDQPELDGVWAMAAKLGAFMFVHPERVAAADRLGSYYLGNLLGNPLDTSIAASSLIFSGVFERHSGLCMCFAHGGGYIPYQRGRLEHGWRVRPEPKQFLQRPPSASLECLYFDSFCTTRQRSSTWCTQSADHVLLGSDYPFDMGPESPITAVTESVSDPEARERILGGMAARLLGIGLSAR